MSDAGLAQCEKRREAAKKFHFMANGLLKSDRYLILSLLLGHAHFAHLFHEALSGCGLFLFAHYAWLFIMLPFLHLRKNAGFLYLFFKTTQRYVKIIVFFIEKNAWQRSPPCVQIFWENTLQALLWRLQIVLLPKAYIRPHAAYILGVPGM